MSQFLWKIGGEAGFGIMLSGLSFSKIAAKSGYHIFDYAEYPSLIRGGHNTYEVLIADTQVDTSKESVNLLVCLNKQTYEFHKHRLTPESLVIYDPQDLENIEVGIKVPVPFRQFRKDFTIMQMMVNTIALGASLAVLDGDLELLLNIIKTEFAKKSQEVIDFNIKLAKTGFEYIHTNYPEYIQKVLTKKIDKEKLVLTGNDAFAYGAVVADCRFYCAYPMTPSSSVLTSLAAWQEHVGMVVRHAEDEISVINTALGSSFAGVRSAVGTSGGGFALMVEAISYAGIAEIPIVIYLGQRPGPATGMPSWTEQGDILFAAHAGHGEFPKIVLAPGDIQEMIELTTKAFDLADIYQTPVIVMSDKLLGESHYSIYKDNVVSFSANYQPERGKTISYTDQQPYLRYKLSSDGVSERLLPGQKGIFYQANSYEHIEDSHTTELAQPRIDQVDKRNKKIQTYFNEHFKLPKVYGNLDTAEIVLVSWGGNKGAIQEAQSILKNQGHEIAYIHFTHVYPLDKQQLLGYFKTGKRYIMIENNSQGQFAQLLRQQTGITLSEQLLKYDGRPFFPKDIVSYINKKHI